MQSRLLLRALLIAGLIVVSGSESFSPRAHGQQRPNIVLCMGDDHGWDETGYNGHPHLKTPVLDEMAASGLRLDRFYAAHPSCSPTRGSIITGRHPNRYGTFAPNWSLRPEEISIAQLLSQAGYACGHFGKWHLGPVKEDSPTNPGAMGFDEWLSHDNFFELHPWLSRNGAAPRQFRGESSEILVDEALRFAARARENDQPFFIVIWFGSPHEPYSGLPDDLARYQDVRDQYPGKTVRLTSNKTGLPTQRPLGEVLQERYAEITAMDRALGQLRQWLQQQKLRDDTLLWYCGDNGTPSGGSVTSPLRGQKGTMYECGTRVPGIIEWPRGLTAARRSKVPAVTSDMLPTLCDLLELPLPDRPLDGISLKPLLSGEMEARPTPICFWSYPTGVLARRSPKPYIAPALQEGTTPLVKQMAGRYTRNFRNFHHPEVTEQDFGGPRVILDNRYKLVIHDAADGTPRQELFDLEQDPAETKNLVEAQPDRAAELGKQLRAWQQSVLHSVQGHDYEE